jgi:hypothetical protein
LRREFGRLSCALAMEFAFPAAAGKTAIELMTPVKTGSHMLGLKEILIVALGGAVGSVARYKLGGFALHHTQAWNFPVSTFAVNVAGCLAIGILAALVEHHDLFSPSVRLARRLHDLLRVRLRKRLLAATRIAFSRRGLCAAQRRLRIECSSCWNQIDRPILAAASLGRRFTRTRANRFPRGANWKLHGSRYREED